MTTPTDPAPWWTTLDNQIAVTTENRLRRAIGINYPLELYPLVLEAAKLRDMSMTAYQRRAALAFAQADLGFDWKTVMAAEPVVSTFTKNRGTAVGGTGFGHWQILRLGNFDA